MALMTKRFPPTSPGAALLLLAASVLPACAPARASEAKSPDGEPGWLEITCRHSQDECAKKAKELCGGPYAVRESDGRLYDGPGGAFYSGSMLIRCSEPARPAAPVDQTPPVATPRETR